MKTPDNVSSGTSLIIGVVASAITGVVSGYGVVILLLNMITSNPSWSESVSDQSYQSLSFMGAFLFPCASVILCPIAALALMRLIKRTGVVWGALFGVLSGAAIVTLLSIWVLASPSGGS